MNDTEIKAEFDLVEQGFKQLHLNNHMVTTSLEMIVSRLKRLESKVFEKEKELNNDIK